MVDAHALGACGCGRAGSNPASPTSFRRLCNAVDELVWFVDAGVVDATLGG